MNIFGGWEVKFSTSYPQKVATALGKLNETLLGAEYKPIAYLGSQAVNGINHAVLAEQTLIVGKDSKNAVVIVFNEQPGAMDLALVAIRTIVESGGALGGTTIDMTTDIPKEAMAAFEVAMVGFVGSKIEPVVYIGSQVTKGTNFIMIAEVTPVVPDATTSLAIITVNELDGSIKFESVFDAATEEPVLKYSIVKGVKVPEIKLGTPLGEWP